ncbi:MAG: prepilin-type N-terminal cleavage/methylation domain-containing protein [Patescibacteria group bacterium]|nr:prepilin-type N-terminal cleavage/methylation domain-containing protein [Patescibacteria group bacterium]
MQNLYKKIFRNKNGFTLVELIVAIALIVIIATITVLNLSSYSRSRQLESESKKIVAVLRDTQSKAMTGQGGGRWGVNFTNVVDAGDKYEVFSGLNYANGIIEKVINFNPAIQFSDPSSGSAKEVVFQPVSGDIGGDFSIIISLVSNPQLQKHIKISPIGVITIEEVTPLPDY